MFAKLKARHRVNKGTRLLNKKEPGWKKKVNPSTLVMNLPDRCVLGQLYGGYRIGKSILNLNENAAMHHGFDSSMNVDYDHLEEAWKRKLVNA